jgi:hypothetical protein
MLLIANDALAMWFFKSFMLDSTKNFYQDDQQCVLYIRNL